MDRREFLSLPLFAGAQRRRKKPAKAQPPPLNHIERAQLLAAIPDERIRLALDIRFLSLWTIPELEAELAARQVRVIRTGQR